MSPDVRQATVRQWHAGGGSVLLDDGTELPYAAEAVAAPLRRLRTGQRVHLRLEEGRVVALTLWTLPLPG